MDNIMFLKFNLQNSSLTLEAIYQLPHSISFLSKLVGHHERGITEIFFDPTYGPDDFEGHVFHASSFHVS